MFTFGADLCNSHEQYANLSPLQLIVKSLEENPVLTINFRNIVSPALLLDPGDTDVKGEFPTPHRVPGDGSDEGQHKL